MRFDSKWKEVLIVMVAMPLAACIRSRQSSLHLVT